MRFLAFIVVALIVFVFILRVVLRVRTERPSWLRVLTTATVVVAGGMLFAKVGQNSGLPWWIYYTVPMLVTVLTPPLVFQEAMTLPGASLAGAIDLNTVSPCTILPLTLPLKRRTRQPTPHA